MLSQHADTKAHLPGLNANPYFKHADPGAIPELYDVPIGFVNQVVYGPHH